MREHDLRPKRCRRFVATTDSDHDSPIFPDLARDRIVDGPKLSSSRGALHQPAQYAKIASYAAFH
jgi:hypothetical protein